MSTSRHARAARGFTLVETMVVVSIIGTLTSLVFPSLEGSLQRARRSDALASVMQVQLAQERFRADNPGYGSLSQIGQAAVSSLGHYTLRATANGTTGYEIVAVATGLQARDAACRHLRLVADASGFSYTSGADASTANTAALNRRCWNR